MHAVKSIFLFLVLIAPIYAQNISAEKVEFVFDIQPDNSVLQTTKFFFISPLTDSANYTLNEMVSNIEVAGDTERLEYATTKIGNVYNLQIFLKRPVKTLAISYIADNVIFRSDSVNHFFTEFAFEQQLAINATLKLPAGYGIYQNAYRPANANIASDGTRIILSWEENNVKGILFSVKFASLSRENNILILFLFLLIGAIVYLVRYFRRKTREAFLKGFREDEKKVVDYLEHRKYGLQSDLQKEFKFSRAKATRIVMHLEAKGLVRKQRYGRTNKLFWLK